MILVFFGWNCHRNIYIYTQCDSIVLSICSMSSNCARKKCNGEPKTSGTTSTAQVSNVYSSQTKLKKSLIRNFSHFNNKNVRLMAGFFFWKGASKSNNKSRQNQRQAVFIGDIWNVYIAQFFFIQHLLFQLSKNMIIELSSIVCCCRKMFGWEWKKKKMQHPQHNSVIEFLEIEIESST